MEQPRTVQRKNRIPALLWVAGVVFAVLSMTQPPSAHAAVGCSLNDPEGDLRRFFPDLTDFSINYLSFAVQDPDGHPLLEKRLQVPLDPVYETPDVPYTLYTIRRDGEVLGYVFGANQRGTYSNIQVIAVTNPALELVDVYLQKIRSPDYQAFQSERFRKNLARVSFDHYPNLVSCYRDGQCKKAAVADPTEGRENKDYQHILRALAKLRILSEILLQPGEIVHPGSTAALAQWVCIQWMPERGFLLIHDPHFVSPAQANQTFMTSDGEVLIWRHGKMTRAYPLSILSQHPVVHDMVDGRNVTITWSSPSRTALVLDEGRTDQAVTFSNTGQALFGHQLIMDVKTQSIWSPVLSRSIQGPRAGEKLKQLPGAVIMPWKTAARLYPEALVLAPPSGYSAFAATYAAHRLRYAPRPDHRLVVTSGEARASFPLGTLQGKQIHVAQVDNIPVVVFSEAGAFAPYSARVEDHILTFEKAKFENDRGIWLYRDLQTKSLWRGLSGEAVEGPLRGKRLSPVVAYQLPHWTWASLFSQPEK